MRFLKPFLAVLGLTFLSAVLTSPVLAASNAGRVAFAVGEVSAVNAAGQSRRLRRGASLFSGDLISTKRGRAQLQFTDGGRISLSPQTDFQIQEYKFSGHADGTERGLFRFIKGGLRALTGLIGKANRGNYRVDTPVATIGIRGTWFNAQLISLSLGSVPVLHISVGYDPNDATSIILSNKGGELVVGRGGSAKVVDQNTAPEPSDVQVSFSSPQVNNIEEPVFVAGDQRNESGSQTIVAGTTGIVVKSGLIGVDVLGAHVIFPSEPGPITEHGTFRNGFLVFQDGVPILAAGEDSGVEPDFVAGLGLITVSPTVIRGLGSALQGIVDGADAADFDLIASKPAVVADFIESNGLTWWRWTNGLLLGLDVLENGDINVEVDEFTGNQSHHIIVGPPPTFMPTTGTATYTFVGSTDSSTESGAGPTGNGVTSGMLQAFFGTAIPFVSVNLNVDHGGAYNVNGSVDIDGHYFSTVIGGSMVTATGSGTAGTACTVGCPVDMSGFFSGTNTSTTAPPAAGISFVIQETDPIIGAAGFERLDASP